jgi:peptidoglycan hydrolase-like protein with peptidoglycan-binding domain
MRHLGFLSASLLAAAVVATPTLGSAQTSTPSTTDKVEQKAGQSTDKATDTAKDKLQDAKEKAKETGHRIADKARDLKNRMKDKMQGKTDRDRMEHGGQQRVRDVQQALKDKGFDPGPIDGVQGPQTTAALKAYQKAEGLEATGKVDPQTMTKLNMSEGATPGSSSTSSTPGSPSGPSTTPSKKQTP